MNKEQEQNLLDLIPKRMNDFEKQDDGLVSVIQPKFRNRFFIKYLIPRLKRPFFKVQLDEFGSAVWEACDGQNTVGQIGEKMHQKFGEKVEPVYDRLSAFFQSLYRLKFIHYTNYQKK